MAPNTAPCLLLACLLLLLLLLLAGAASSTPSSSGKPEQQQRTVMVGLDADRELESVRRLPRQWRRGGGHRLGDIHRQFVQLRA